MSAASENGVVAPRVVPPVTYGEGKVEALREGTRGARLVGAFGDSAYDFAMLRAAEVGVAVRPKPELRSLADECPRLVDLAPRAPSTASRRGARSSEVRFPSPFSRRAARGTARETDRAPRSGTATAARTAGGW